MAHGRCNSSVRALWELLIRCTASRLTEPARRDSLPPCFAMCTRGTRSSQERLLGLVGATA